MVQSPEIKIVPLLKHPHLVPILRDESPLSVYWPEFTNNAKILCKYLPYIFDRPALAGGIFVALVRDDSTGREKIVGNSLSIPFHWAHPSDDASLPQGGWERALVSGVELELSQDPHKPKTNALCALEVTIHPDYRYKQTGRDLASELLLKMKEHARQSGFVAMVVPVRPPLKQLPEFVWMDMNRYCSLVKEEKKVPIEETRSRPDGELVPVPKGAKAFDSWIQKHLSLGARIVGVCHESYKVKGTRSEWENWTGVNFSVPSTRPYMHAHDDEMNDADDDPYEVVVPGGLVPVKFYPARDLGVYIEPNLWMRHF
ncbi:hypothetical protein R1flu_011201 [Riccia fluitans]|uniref:N-acetyltransferase domain-containing protein n=1 Tax=Riccia fluitans TaxID=41844 RepID=A0ABD1Z881_9MARC